ncbi:Leucine-rich repeat, ribonuclease inhibitor subtype [Plasmopara halstedii]|uniref:Leucine-rich repeat, ribonuclease inhibitor subtype n=1 Tax=Plasmopara halstedii TaxID=4781 RepID=A0A0P1AUE8_PLAHL|nr:Leucine-rich repeat, ribonuclease inhibitor subtype [Plasmopara halstedii]CEG44874.1 Leucine-rich repeat, ribonuclease inhibitor subtype [Plasmopara halstedii]|eukprot:XP_024581243.1 Leucine-rich repeat, ribonuclease inhibitor subtype [Plasmopara halstedii]
MQVMQSSSGSVVCQTKYAKVYDEQLQTMQLDRAPWQCISHLPNRRLMVQRILQLSQHSRKFDINPDRAVLLAKHIELALYSRAGSLVEYCNLATFQRRLQSLVASSVHEATACKNLQKRKYHLVTDHIMQGHRALKRRRYTASNLFPLLGEDCTRRIFAFLDGKELMQYRVLNQFAAAFLPSCALTLAVEVTQLTNGLSSDSSLLQMTNIQHLTVYQRGIESAANVGSAITPLYAWTCPDRLPSQSNDGESAVLALADALSAGVFPSLTKLQLNSVFVNTMSGNALRALCNTLATNCCPHLNDFLLAGNSIADLGAIEIAHLLHSTIASRLTRLDLRRNFIGESGMRAILSALTRHSNPVLQVLCLGGNLVTDNCVKQLQQLLANSRCSKLRFLGLEDNFLSVDGVQRVLETAAVSSLPSKRPRRVSCDGAN